MNWNIRAMTAADVPQVAAMERACFSDPWPEQVIAKELENELSLWLVAAKGETVLGYVGSQTVLGEADMMNLAVGAEHRRQGIAAALLAEARAYARKNEMTRICLEVRASNAAARSLYEDFGFEEDGVRPGFYDSPKEDAVLYSLYI